MMKKLFFTMLALVPLTLWAQDNTWELNEEEEVKKEEKAKPKVDEKYLKGAVPEVDGKVVFSTSINAPGKTAAQIYDILLQYMERMTKTTNQIQSKIITADADKHEITGAYQEWLVFKKTALSLDRTRFMYALNAQCSDGRADIKMTRIRYLYEEERSPQHMTAEEWITDKEAVNKKNTKLLPISGKFRRKTIDRKDFLFNKFESLLK
jgi:colicin import membrane protein